MTDRGTATIEALVDNLETAGFQVTDVGTRYRVTNPDGGAAVFVPKRLPKGAALNGIMKSLVGAGYDAEAVEAAKESARRERVKAAQEAANKVIAARTQAAARKPSPAVFQAATRAAMEEAEQRRAEQERARPPLVATSNGTTEAAPIPRSEVIGVDGKFALQLLEANNFYDQGVDHAGHCNRRYRPALAAGYAEAMLRGEWTLGDSIKFDVNDDLIDGQHRLMAVIIAAETQPDIVIDFVVTYDLPVEAAEHLDQGLKRTVPDMLQMTGEKNTLHLSAAIRLVHNYDEDRATGRPFNMDIWRRKTFTRDQAFKTLEANPRLRESVALAQSVSTILIRSSAAAALYLIQREWDADYVSAFVEGIASGAGLDKGSPILALRETMRRVKDRYKGVTRRDGGVEDMAFTILAWNLWIKGKQRHVSYTWDPSEGFPTVVPRPTKR